MSLLPLLAQALPPTGASDGPAWVYLLPAVNATLNGLTTCTLIAGRVAIAFRHKPLHAAFMITSVLLSTLFLTCYVTYHSFIGITPFSTPGWPKLLYYFILIPHVILAVVILPFIAMALYFASQARFEAHTRVTRWLWPTWIYVSVTGVLVYLMLYVWFPGQPHSGI